MNAVFLALLLIMTILIWIAPKPSCSTHRALMLRLLFLTAFLALLAHQTYWQLFGDTDPAFVTFMRRHNRRPNAAQRQIIRGTLFDRHGNILSAPVPGSLWERRYPLGEAGAHPIGYFDAMYGITGIERVCDPTLSGYDFDIRKTRDALSRQPRTGPSVTLSLDTRLQRKAYTLLAGRPGAVVILNPRTGEILALCSAPGFDPNQPHSALFDATRRPAFNRATQGLYPPGSTFKLFIAALAIDHKRDIPLNCPAGGYIAARDTPPIRDSEYYAATRSGKTWRGWGRLSLHDAIVHSSNVYFAQLAVRCGTDAFNTIVNTTSLAHAITLLRGPTDVFATASGNIPDVQRDPQLAALGIGQGDLLLTPLHIAMLTAAIANNGTIHPPTLEYPATPRTPLRFCSADAARRIRHAMRDVVKNGTGRAANIPGLDVCGKTGTAQVAHGDDHAWFTCCAPENNPDIVITVLIEHGGFGAQSALPVARELLIDAQRRGFVRRATP